MTNNSKKANKTVANILADKIEEQQDAIKKIKLVNEVNTDALNPSHYKEGKIECKEVIKLLTAPFYGYTAFSLGDIIKYIFRCPKKNGIEDVRKCYMYMIDFLQDVRNMSDEDFEKIENYFNKR